MSRTLRIAALGAVVVLLAAPAAWADPNYPSAVVTFDGPGSPGDAQEMFRIPQTSGSTYSA